MIVTTTTWKKNLTRIVGTLTLYYLINIYYFLGTYSTTTTLFLLSLQQQNSGCSLGDDLA